ncbi:MAG: hypothetical protein AAFU03_04175 [Bacteroidota bacterium]
MISLLFSLLFAVSPADVPTETGKDFKVSTNHNKTIIISDNIVK